MVVSKSNRVAWPLAVAIVFALLTGPVLAQESRKSPDNNIGSSLGPRLVAAIQKQVASAYFRGDPVATVESIGELLPKLNDIQLIEANDILASLSAPSLDAMLIQARLNVVLQGLSQEVKAPSRHELLVIVPETKRRVQEIVDAVARHPAMQLTLPAPSEFSEYEELFWRVHVLEQQLTNAIRLAEFGKRLNGRGKRFVRRASDAEKAILETAFDSEANKLTEAFRELEERKTELRIQRIELALHKLITSEDRREKLDAAYVASHDGELVKEFFAKLDAQRKQGKPISLRRPGLQGKELEAEVAELTDTALKAAGKLAEKGRLLYTGIHWWLRGRYGRGSDGGGLLKPRNAIRSPQDMFRLYMPEQLYGFDKSQASQLQAPIDRRHHYVWAFEPRRIVKQQYNDTSTITNDTATSKTTLKYFY